MGLIFSSSDSDEEEDDEQICEDLTKADEHPRVEGKSNMVEVLDRHRTAWKATQNYVARLVIPKGTIVVHTGGNKKRAGRVYVHSFHSSTRYGNGRQTEVGLDYGIKDDSFVYKRHTIVTPEEDLSVNPMYDCESGIHFFRTKKGADDWHRKRT